MDKSLAGIAFGGVFVADSAFPTPTLPGPSKVTPESTPKVGNASQKGLPAGPVSSASEGGGKADLIPINSRFSSPRAPCEGRFNEIPAMEPELAWTGGFGEALENQDLSPRSQDVNPHWGRAGAPMAKQEFRLQSPGNAQISRVGWGREGGL